VGGARRRLWVYARDARRRAHPLGLQPLLIDAQAGIELGVLVHLSEEVADEKLAAADLEVAPVDPGALAE